jgi:hypothetical protein
MAILIYDQHNGSRPRGIWTREFNGIEWNLMEFNDIIPRIG